MTPEQQIDNVRAQLDAITHKRTNTFNCPYCKVATREGDRFCCELATKAVKAVLDRMDVVDMADDLERIQEHASRN